MTLLLRCGLCPRTQAEGLLSRSAWGFVRLGDGRTVQVCPACKADVGWEDRVRAMSAEGRVGAVFRSDERA